MSVSKGSSFQKIKPKTAQGKRFLNNREPKPVEDVKTAIFMKSTKTSEFSSQALSDLYSLKKPDAVMMQKKNSIHPFEGGNDESSLEFLAQRNDAAFSLLAHHSKKRPHSLVMTRFFDGQILDMFEMCITAFRSIAQIGGPTCAVGTKPSLVFSGNLWEEKEDLKKIQNVFLDFFRGLPTKEINLSSGVQSVIFFTATVEGLIMMRVYKVCLKKSGTHVPLIKLEEMGPSIDFKLGRTRFAPSAVMKEALKQPRELQQRKEKNISTTAVGEKLGRVHVGDQKLDDIQVRKMKAFKKGAKRSAVDNTEDQEASSDE